MELIISLLSGAVGGNIAGALLKKFSMGTLWNSVVGILGGGLGGTIFSMLGLGGVAAAGASSSLDVTSILGSIAGGGVGGGVVLAIIGFIKKAMNKG